MDIGMGIYQQLAEMNGKLNTIISKLTDYEDLGIASRLKVINDELYFIRRGIWWIEDDMWTSDYLYKIPDLLRYLFEFEDNSITKLFEQAFILDIEDNHHSYFGRGGRSAFYDTNEETLTTTTIKDSVDTLGITVKWADGDFLFSFN